jgi:ubiquitin C-terminal hydrolase
MHKRINYNKKLKDKNIKKSSDTNNSSYFIIGSIIVICVAGAIYISQKSKADNPDYSNQIKFGGIDTPENLLKWKEIIKNEPTLLTEGFGQLIKKHPVNNCRDHHIGFSNDGNKCYQNAAIQCLLASQPLMDEIMKQPFSDRGNETGITRENKVKFEFIKIAKIWKDCILEVWTNQALRVNLQNGKWSSVQQQDSAEFLLDLMNELIVTMPSVKNIFNCGLTDRLTCNTCKKFRNTSDNVDPETRNPFDTTALILPLTLPKPTKVILHNPLMECFETTFGSANVPDIMCSDCNKKTITAKQSRIMHQSECLIIQLKRFKNIGKEVFNAGKDDQSIEISSELVLDEYLVESAKSAIRYKYNLYAIIHHNGGPNGGHYYADCKSEKNQKWYRYNDSLVSEQGPTLNGATPYILFYQRQLVVPSSAAAASP